MGFKKQVTISQVARAAKVSTQTVSRVVNNRPDVAPQTRQRVEEVITRMGYRPNALARSLIHQRSHTMGVVAMASEYFGPSRTLVGIEQQVRSLNYSLLLDLLHHPEIEDVEQILNRLLSRQVDGIIWAVPEISNNRVWLKRKTFHLPVPIIYLSMQPQEKAATASIDNLAGGRLATQHLLDQGYRNIGILTGPLDWWEARQRHQGWQDTLANAGLPAKGSQMVEGNWSAASGEQGIRQLFEQLPEIDAVFACNDQMALGVLQAAHRIGRRVPGDLAVVGFDNTPESAYFWPPLTTVEQPLIELGCQAVQELAHLIEADLQNAPEIRTETILLQPELVVRESST